LLRAGSMKDKQNSKPPPLTETHRTQGG